MEIVFNTKHNSLDIHCYEPTYALISTSKYMTDVCEETKNDSNIMIAKHSELEDYGWGDDVEIEIGERLISDIYGECAQLIRLS